MGSVLKSKYGEHTDSGTIFPWDAKAISDRGHLVLARHGNVSESPIQSEFLIYDRRIPEMEKSIRKLEGEVRELREAMNVCFKRMFLIFSESYNTMLASEAVLKSDWDTPEEDEAWENL